MFLQSRTCHILGPLALGVEGGGCAVLWWTAVLENLGLVGFLLLPHIEVPTPLPLPTANGSNRVEDSRPPGPGVPAPAVLLHACMHSSSNHSGVSVASALMVWLLYCATVQAFLAWHRRSFVRFFQRECHECDICNVLLLFFPIVTLQLGRKRHSTNTGHYVLEIATSS